MAGWEHFRHDADIGVHGWGANPAAAFEQAAMAMTAVVAELATVRPERRVEVACDAPDLELLLVDWLNAWVYEMSVQRMLFSRFVALIDDGRLRGEGWGEAVDVARHHPGVEVKGATYTALRVAREADGQWHARCVVDV
ncbi:MAG: archease [Pseudomonadota bacterium]